MEKVVMTVTTLQKVITKKPCTKEALVNWLNFVVVVVEKSSTFAKIAVPPLSGGPLTNKTRCCELCLVKWKEVRQFWPKPIVYIYVQHIDEYQNVVSF